MSDETGYPETGYVWRRLHNRDKLTLAKKAGLEHREGGCRICGVEADVLALDHDHVTGLTRAFICQPCNVKVAYAERPTGEAYLRRYRKFATIYRRYLAATVWEGEARNLAQQKKEDAYIGLSKIG